MAVTLRIPGQPEVAPPTTARGAGAAVDAAPVTDLLDDVEIVHAFSLSPAARAQSVAPTPIIVEDDDIVEIEVDGFQLWTSARKYEETVRAVRPEVVQGGGVVVDALPTAGTATRGEGDRSASAVRVLRLAKTRLEDQLKDPAIIKEFAEDFGLNLVERAGSWVLAKALVWLIERQLRPREGLYHWRQVTGTPERGTPEPVQPSLDQLDPEPPLLLFLHGTGSSTRGSFGEFLETGSADQWKELTGYFKDRIYAFEHKTLSRSPVENAIAVATRLPAKANLYLVSHSRGGMIGDLLSLRSIDPALVNAFTRHGEYDEADAYDRDRLTVLSDLLTAKQFKVQRFARAACPARGTLLASENLDQFLSVITYLVGLIPFLKASPLYEIVKRITLETVHRRWEPGMLPGVEAMTPASPLVRLLNTANDDADGALGVIAGDIQGGSWLKRFGTFISDRAIYENKDNDLVVNTDSMFRGAARRGARYVFDQGADVSHFNYFKNRRTRTRVSQWLTAKNVQALSDFRVLEEALVAPKPMSRVGDNRAAGSKPIAVLVPDFMGSDLHAGDTRIWLNYDALSSGGFATLADLGPNVKTVSMLAEHYQPLATFLSNTHDVVPFAYDWRRSTVDAAKKLSETIEPLLGSSTQPLRIVAHGAGGLVVRQMARLHPDLWKAWTTKDAGNRVVLLGTPHAGTYDAVELLLGTHPIAQQLALLDPARGPRGIIEILQGFPGLLELLPREAPGFSTAAGWMPFHAARRDAAAIDPNLLETARGVATSIDGQTLDPAVVCNVAGTAPRTVARVEPKDGRLVFDVTTEGDGRVLFRSTRVPNLPTWYIDAPHGGLAADDRALSAVLELLQNGTSSHAPTSPPSTNRGGEQTRQTLPEKVLYPTDRELLVGVFGRAGHRPHASDTAAPAGFRVSVVHGDLTFARFPIVVGHYEGDTIIGPESVVDRIFDGALTTRYHLGLYPGALGTFAVVFRHPTPLQKALQLPPGAIVVGLGRWGELTAGQIANIIRRGAIEFVLQLDDHQPRGDGAGRTGSRDVGLSVLLIGATASNLSTEDSVAAILRGIAQANLELETFVDRIQTRIAEIEIVELYVDSAIEAARAARRMAAALSDELKIPIDAAPLLQRGRYGRTRWASARNLDAWRRWEITMLRSPETRTEIPRDLRRWLAQAAARDNADPALWRALAGIPLTDAEAPPNDRLRFVSLSDRARAEVIMDQHQPELIERLIKSSITDTSYKPDDARALFELMVPNDLKDGLGQLSNVVFVLDGETSAYPWELMTDGGDRPLCTRLRIVRQLQSATFRPHIRVTTSRAAYVVGDPKVSPPFQQLAGARAEAQVVNEKLASRFEPVLVPAGATALQVLGGLFARPYRIVHLAGHGDFREKKGDLRERSGMVLDNGAFLTAAEVRKMVQVPELVFLNCCFIGQVGPEAGAEEPTAYNRLAASISRELIEMGVRAVVAAGWAVRDDAALLFAQTFYDEMLNGATFGRAITEARKRTWQRFPDANTWGAYQAYGDPDFRLVTIPQGGRVDESVAHEELLEQIDRIWKRARKLKLEQDFAAADPKHTHVKSQHVTDLDKLLTAVPQTWLTRSDVAIAVAEAYGELGAFGKAIERYEYALDTGELDSKTTIKAAEQLLNFIAREAEERKDVNGLQAAIRRLTAMQGVAPTAERYNLLGGAQKRLAIVLEEAAEVRAAVTEAVKSYGQALERRVKKGTFDHYPAVNQLALQVLLGEAPDEWEEVLRKSELNARERFISERGTKDAVFHALAPADIAVVHALASGTFDAPGDTRTREVQRIVSLYGHTLQLTEATPRQKDSVADQVRLLQTFVEKLEGPDLSPEAESRRDALREIAEALAAS